MIRRFSHPASGNSGAPMSAAIARRSDLSVIICSHNPRREYLDRVLGALRGQTLPQSQWEVLVVDSASREPLQERVGLEWHPSARIVREDEPGLTRARL